MAMGRDGKKRGERSAYTGFGRVCRKIMWDRDIRSWTRLSEVIEDKTGQYYSHQSLSKYAAGSVQIPSEFPVDFARALKLTDAERADFEHQFTFNALPGDASKRPRRSA